MRDLSALLLLAILATAPAAAQDRTPDLPIGDPARRDRHVPVVLDGITDTARGDVLTPPELAARLDGVRLLFVGESHTSQEFHNVQLRVIQELQKRGRRIILGLEMYPYTEQRWLDQWSSPRESLTEDQFLERSGWYRNWGYHWNYYRDIFRFAREHGIGLHGVNVPRTVVQAARLKGLDALDAEARAYLPQRIDLDSAEHRRLFRSYFGEGDGTHAASLTAEQWDGLFRAQATWDAAMGYGAVKALEKDGNRATIAVVLIGAGHVAYGLGAERQAALWFTGRIASLIPVLAADERGRPADRVRASYANFVWGIAPERAPLYPVTGISTGLQKQGDFHPIIGVSKGSAGEAAGIKVGDRLVSVDGVPVDSIETLNRLLSEKRWGDAAVYRLERGGAPLTITLLLRRTPAATEGDR